jgi:y4mF family transcriptional regulator
MNLYPNRYIMDSKKVHQFVKEKRKALGLTQEEFSYKAGVGLRFIRELEQGKPTLQMNKVNQVLKLFGYEPGPVPVDRNELTHEES